MIISGFAGIGKTTFCKKFKNSIDLESSDFHWIYEEDALNMDKEKRKGTTKKMLNPEWPKNYVKAIQEKTKESDFVFICQDKDVRNLLDEKSIRYFLAYPVKECKEEYISRYKERENGENFVKLLESKFDEWVDMLEKEEGSKIRLKKGEFISDKLN